MSHKKKFSTSLSLSRSPVLTQLTSALTLVAWSAGFLASATVRADVPGIPGLPSSSSSPASGIPGLPSNGSSTTYSGGIPGIPGLPSDSGLSGLPTSTSDPTGQVVSNGSHGSSGANFSPVAIDLNLKCSSIVLKGTAQFAGVAFVLPRFYISKKDDQETLFKISPPTATRTDYMINFGVYFPYYDEAFRIGQDEDGNNFYGHECSREQVMSTLNSADPAHPAYKVLAGLPVSNIQIGIDGLNDPVTGAEKFFDIGDKASDIVDYQGKDKLVEFHVTKADADLITEKLKGFGLSFRARIIFSARQPDGYASVHVNLKQISADLKPEFSGQLNSGITADFRTALTKEVNNQTANVVVEEGTDNTVDSIVQGILAGIPAANAVFPNTQPSNNPYYGGYYPGGIPGIPGLPGDNGQGGGGTFPSPNPIAPQLTIQNAIDYMNTKGAYDFTYQSSGKPSSFTYITNAVLVEPSQRTVRLRSGEAATRLMITLDTDHTIQINPPELVKKTYTYSFDWKESDLYRFKFSEMQDLLANGTDSRQFFNLAFPRTRNLSNNAFYKFKDPAGNEVFSYIRDGGVLDHLKQVRWGQATMTVQTTSSASAIADPTYIDLASSDDALEITFSELPGRSFKPSQLTSDLPGFWHTSMSNGKLNIQPLANLGFMDLRNKTRTPTTQVPANDGKVKRVAMTSQASVPAVYFEEYYSTHQAGSIANKWSLFGGSVPMTFMVARTYANLPSQQTEIDMPVQIVHSPQYGIHDLESTSPGTASPGSATGPSPILVPSN